VTAETVIFHPYRFAVPTLKYVKKVITGVLIPFAPITKSRHPDRLMQWKW
jgi:hypothetical protein